MANQTQAWLECLKGLDDVSARNGDAWLAPAVTMLLANQVVSPDELIGLSLEDLEAQGCDAV
jgi:hypothetical protein